MTDPLEQFAGPGDFPEELWAYFSKVGEWARSRQGLNLGLLSFEGAVYWTSMFRDLHPVVRYFRGVVLDDPETSNHHVYLTTEPCAGAVYYLDHDGDSRVVFPSLEAFIRAVTAAIDLDRPLAHFHPVGGVLLPDQTGLRRLIAASMEQGVEEDFRDFVPSLIASFALTDIPLLEQLVKDEDFFFAEAVGLAIAQAPRDELLPIATICSQHKVPQAAAAGTKALAAIASTKKA